MAVFLVERIIVVTLTHPETCGSIKIGIEPVSRFEMNTQILHVIGDLGIKAGFPPPFVIGLGKIAQVIFSARGVKFIESTFTLTSVGKFGFDTKPPTIIEAVGNHQTIALLILFFQELVSIIEAPCICIHAGERRADGDGCTREFQRHNVRSIL
ncbi:hypothetical protein D3C79_752340 [compost metagenome]